MKVRVLLADDHGVIRAGLHALLQREHDIEVVGEAVDGEEAITQALRLKPDLILLDITMPAKDGIQVTRELKQRLPHTRILILTLHEGVSMLREAIAAGASGYVPKRAIDVELINAIRTVSRGEMYVHPSMTLALMKDLAPETPATGAGASPLTAREIQVLQLIAQGYTNAQIAKALVLSVRTVETHRANLTSKLGLTSRSQLVQYAKEHNLLN